MLEQLQAGTSSGTHSAAEGKAGKNGKAGVFANLFSALAHKKGQVAKAISTGDVEKNKTHQKVKTLQALLKPDTIDKTATGRNGEKLLNTAHPASGKENIQATDVKSANLLSTDPNQKESVKRKTDKQTNTDTTLAAIVQPFGKHEAAKTINSTGDVKNNVSNQAKGELAENSATILTNASETESNAQTNAQDTKQTEINSTNMNDLNMNNRDTTNKVAGDTDKAPLQTPLAADGKPVGQTSTAHVRETITQQVNQPNATPQDDKTMKERIASDNKNRLDTQASLAQQSPLATQKTASIAKPEYNQPSSASPSSANASTAHASVLTLLNQNNGQSAFAQNGQNSGGQLSGGANNIPTPDQAAGQDAGESRFASVLQSENRSTQGYEVNQQLPARSSHPLKAIQAMQHIAMSAKDGITRLELQLEPAHLGKINVSLQTDAAKQLQVHLTVEHAISRQIIEQHIPQLRAALEQQGLSLDQFSLQTGSQQQHAAQNGSSEWANGRQQQQRGELSASAPSDIPINMQTATHGRLSIHI